MNLCQDVNEFVPVILPARSVGPEKPTPRPLDGRTSAAEGQGPSHVGAHLMSDRDYGAKALDIGPRAECGLAG